jgi:excisionase family DNA binding protein
MDKQEFYTTQEAAKVLGLSERRIRQLVNEESLTAEKDGHAWKLFRYSVHNYRDIHGVADRPRDTQEWPLEARDALSEVKDLRYQMGKIEGRLELEAVARSTLEAQLQREQDRADQERERAEQERQERIQAQEEARTLREELEAARKPWYQRFFGR